MVTLLSRYRRSIATRGLPGTFKLGFEKIFALARYVTPQGRAERKRLEEIDTEFDRKYGVETSGIVDQIESGRPENLWVVGSKYQAVNADWLEETLRNLGIPYEDFVFLDFGSGKGRALLIAAGFPFKKIVGVEYSDGLNQIAAANIVRFPDGLKRCKDLSVVCMDAASYTLPNESFVLFMYNPFGRQVMERVVENVARCFQSSPKKILIIYRNAVCAELWDKLPFLKRIGKATWAT